MFIQLPERVRDQIVGLNIDVGAKPEEGLEKGYFAIDLRILDRSKIDQLYEVLKTIPESRSARIHINAYTKGLDNPVNAKVETFRAAAGQLTEYLVRDSIRGWVFKVDVNPIAALITGIHYHPPVKRRGEESEAYISIEAIQNWRGKTQRVGFSIGAAQGTGLTPAEMLRIGGWTKETEELLEGYDAELARFKKIKPMYGKQLRLRSSVLVNADGTTEDRWWSRSSDKKEKVDLAKDHGGRLVNDEEPTKSDFQVSTYRFDDPDNPYIDIGLKATCERLVGKDSGAFTQTPFHMVFKVYHLGQHQNLDLHVRDTEIYEYNKQIRDKLILPGLYGEVLDVLTEDMLLVQDDIVEGKTGGNVVMLAGPPGLGKTLTAEVYAEHREVPLLKIHSGQLGTSADQIEKRLSSFYQRCTRWGCPMLLDEFDVFGRARGTDLMQNAVVAVFLRTLEYQNNTIFLTTNRAEDMDDAILSRCQAIVKFNYPEYEELHQIWKVQRNQLLQSVTDDQIEELMDFFKKSDKKMSGRDVKNILQLAARYKNAGLDVTTERLKVCAGFRGV